jgi:beta-galactosidase
MFCYCDASVNKFRKWLEKKYGTIENLNNAWGHFYTSFDQVRPPRWMSSYADYADFRIFVMDNIRDEIKYRADLIRSLDNKPVLAHSWGGGAVTCVMLGEMAFDDWKNAEVFDKWGFSAFPAKETDCVMLGLGANATRCAANGKDYWQSELTAGLNGTGLNINGRVDDETFDMFNLESIRHGAKGLLYWAYRKERFGQEWGGFSLTANDGSPTNLLNKATALCSSVNKNEEYFCNGTRPDSEVAIVFSVRSYLASWISSERANNKFAVDSISGYYKMLWEENVPVDVLHEDFPVDLDKYKTIILPSPYAVSANFSKRLKEYVANGGMVISDPFYGAFEQDFKHSYQIPGHGFNEVFGADEFDITQKDKVSAVYGDQVEQLLGTKQFEYFCNVNAKVLYKTDNGEPLVLQNDYKKGKAVIFATNFGLSYSNRSLVSDDVKSNDTANSSKVAKAIVLELLSSAGVNKNLCSASGVKVSVLNAKDGLSSLIILINSNHEDSAGEITLSAPATSVSVEYGKVDCNVLNGKVNFSLKSRKSAMLKVSYK